MLAEQGRAFIPACRETICGYLELPMSKTALIVFLACMLQGCATTIAVVDVAASTVVYGARTLVNVIDAVTPDIINRD
jgi:hypothetical protein